MINIKKNNINLKIFLDKIYNINSVNSLYDQIDININIYQLFTVIRIINIFYIEYYDEIIDNKKIFINIIKNIFKKHYGVSLDYVEDDMYKMLDNKITGENYQVIHEVQKILDSKNI